MDLPYELCMNVWKWDVVINNMNWDLIMYNMKWEVVMIYMIYPELIHGWGIYLVLSLKPPDLMDLNIP
jgi:hypothetical protein